MKYFIKQVNFEMTEDDYVEGEIGEVICWSEYPRKEFESLNEALDYILEHNGYTINKYWEKNEDGSFINSIHTNSIHQEADEGEIEEWKKGNLTLYALYIKAEVVKIVELEEGEHYEKDL